MVPSVPLPPPSAGPPPPAPLPAGERTGIRLAVSCGVAVLFGPALPIVAISVASLPEYLGRDDPLADIGRDLAGLPYLLFFGYLVGLIPALAAGFLYGLFLDPAQHWLIRLGGLPALLGGGITAILAALIQPPQTIGFILGIGLVGALAAIACALIIRFCLWAIDREPT